MTRVIRFLLLGSIIVLPLVFFPWTRDMFSLPKQLVWFGVVLLALILHLAQAALRRELVLRQTILDPVMGIFFVIAILSAAMSLSSSVSFFGFQHVFVTHVSAIAAGIAWYWLIVQEISSLRDWRALAVAFLAGSAVSGAIFLFRDIPMVGAIFSFVPLNTVSSAGSVFGAYMAIAAALAAGLLAVRGRGRAHNVLAIVSVAAGVAALLRIGFTLPWIVMAIGLLASLAACAGLLAQARLHVLSFGFFLFLLAALFLFIGSPQFSKKQLPVEIALGAASSWDVSSQAILAGAKSFLVGSGPGTFIYDFSRYRPASFNTDQIAQNIRFYQPFNHAFAFIAETGVMGILLFLSLALLALGIAAGVWQYGRKHAEDDLPALEVSVIGAAWVTATAALFLSFGDLVLWHIWWTLLAMLAVGAGYILPNIVRERRVSLRVSPQYALLLSFALVFLGTAAGAAGVFAVRFVMAETAYAGSQRPGTAIDAREMLVARALRLRPGYSEYRIESARLAFERARLETERPSPDTDTVAAHLARAVEEAKMAAEDDPESIVAWDTLASLYLGARTLAPEANGWAKDALERAIALEPANPALHWQMGSVHEFAGRAKEAEQSYKQSIALRPDYFPAYISLSDAWERSGRFDEAIALYQPIFERIQNNPDLLYRLGRLVYNRQRTKEETREAEALWQKVVSIQPGYANAWYSLGIAAEKRGAGAEAAGYFRKVLELNPGNEEAQKKLREAGG